jgi:glycyl-tRNA synthetase beta chain
VEREIPGVVGVTDFLLELRSEEIPARMQAGARADLEKLFRAEMQAAGVAVGDVTVWSTPRRLALIARGLPEATEAVREETKGPRTSAPPQALDGFLRKSGLTQDQLEERDGVYFAVIEKPGRAVKAVLAEAIPAIVRAFPWPKSMRWGAASLSTESPRWVRPLSGIVAIFGEELVECQVGDVASGYMTLGHRFHHAGPITIGSAADYQEKLRACHVIVDHAERQDLIREGAAKAAADAGLKLVEDEGLVIENAGLTEWPVPLLGRFDEAFLDVPPEVIQLTARVNQKYFVCEAAGKLANAFVCTANIEAADGGAAIVDGNRKVLAARLSDARFFWEQDRKVPLAEQAKKLERITFHEKLGTVADKVERVAKLARWLVEEGIVPSPERGGGGRAAADGGDSRSGPALPASPHYRPADGPPPRPGEDLADLAEQAARLAKADLVTEMVGEFPELQGLMGGYYARAEGLPDAVADAIRDHYKPVGQGDEVPTAPVTVAVSLADKLDTIVSFFAIDERPTGSKDPFALRRAALGVISLILNNGLRVRLTTMLEVAGQLTAHIPTIAELMEAAVKFKGGAISSRFVGYGSIDFFADRLKVQQREAGVRHDLIDAVFALGNEDDLVRLLARVNALQAFIKTEDGANLLAAYKRAANILKKENWLTPSLVTPAKAGAQGGAADAALDSRLRGNDEGGRGSAEGAGGIPRTGEEDPLAGVDDPDLRPVIEAKLAEKKRLSYTPEPAEKALIEALDSAEPKAAAAVQAEDFEAAMAALASLRAPIDKFFDEVTVNDSDPAKRSARLDLLGRFRSAVHEVADFSKIEG